MFERNGNFLEKPMFDFSRYRFSLLTTDIKDKKCKCGYKITGAGTLRWCIKCGWNNFEKPKDKLERMYETGEFQVQEEEYRGIEGL